jgi:nicotinamide mononucleotide transporter
MSVTEIVQQFIQGMHQTTWYEYVAVFAGIASVWFSRKENILVYPIGLINTIIYIFISFKYHLLGEASVNFYYTVMSLYGWWLWTRKDQIKKEIVLHISFSNQKEWIQQLSFFAVFYVAIFLHLRQLKKFCRWCNSLG